jgi:hypothetical protein
MALVLIGGFLGKSMALGQELGVLLVCKEQQVIVDQALQGLASI